MATLDILDIIMPLVGGPPVFFLYDNRMRKANHNQILRVLSQEGKEFDYAICSSYR